MTATSKDNDTISGAVLLTGNPNVGKSVVFSRLTGIGAISSNFPGTTVELNRGKTRIGGRIFQITDVPGTYSIEPTCDAENVACKLISDDEYDLIMHVVDATNLERNLFLTLQILALKKPTLVILNKYDIARMKGIAIDKDKLSSLLGGIPVIPFVAVTGEGAKQLEDAAALLLSTRSVPSSDIPPDTDGKWKLIGRISMASEQVQHYHATFLEKAAALSIQPASGLLIAILIAAASFYTVRTIGEGLINYILDPLYGNYYMPFIEKITAPLGDGFVRHLLTGASQGMGILTEGVRIAFVTVFAYIVAFYFILGFLEDLGYLPRLAVLLDKWMHKLGMHGYGCLPVFMGLGCKVPAILGTRILETRREKVIAFSMILLAAPCMPQSAMIFSILAPHGLRYVAAVFLTLGATAALAGVILNRVMKGETPELFAEVPPYQWPHMKTLLSKLGLRIKHYFTDALPMILAGILVLHLFEITGLMGIISGLIKAPLAALLGLPQETASVIVLGFLRKDVSIALLPPFNLAPEQIAVASVFLAAYLPCVGTLMVMAREAGFSDTAKAVAINLLGALAAASVLRLAFLI